MSSERSPSLVSTTKSPSTVERDFLTVVFHMKFLNYSVPLSPLTLSLNIPQARQQLLELSILHVPGKALSAAADSGPVALKV